MSNKVSQLRVDNGRDVCESKTRIWIESSAPCRYGISGRKTLQPRTLRCRNVCTELTELFGFPIMLGQLFELNSAFNIDKIFRLVKRL